MALKFTDFLLCFNKLKAFTIEMLIIIISFIGIVLSILGIIFIPWKITNRAMEILYIIAIILIALSIILAVMIVYFRLKHKLSRRIIQILLFGIIIILFVCFLALIIFIIIAFGTFSDLNNTETTVIQEVIEHTGEIKNTTTIETDLTTSSKKVFTIVTISLLLFIWIILLLLWVSDYIRLIYNTELSFKEYIKREKNRQLKHPFRYGLNVIGHDKYGFPIFGKQIGRKIIVKGVKKNFEKEKLPEKFSSKYVDENGNINIRYYANYPEKPEKKQIHAENQKIYEEKYQNGASVDEFQNYSNYFNKTILNFEDNNNSINPGYDI